MSDEKKPDQEEQPKLSAGRKPAPEVKGTADKPMGTARSQRVTRIIESQVPEGINARLTDAPASEPKPRNWKEQLDWTRHKFAQWLVVGALVAIFVMSLMQYWWPREEQSFTSTINIFQIVATTALGYVIGRSDASDGEKN